MRLNDPQQKLSSKSQSHPKQLPSVQQKLQQTGRPANQHNNNKQATRSNQSINKSER
jgi:hypothetical protein